MSREFSDFDDVVGARPLSADSHALASMDLVALRAFRVVLLGPARFVRTQSDIAQRRESHIVTDCTKLRQAGDDVLVQLG